MQDDSPMQTLHDWRGNRPRIVQTGEQDGGVLALAATFTGF
jgi:hypothetical protein